MQDIYVSHKQVKRTPMTRLQWVNYREWKLPLDEDGDDEGYLVEDIDGGKPNHPAHKGYISWSPKEQFDAGYTKISTKGLTFGDAILAARRGSKIAREGWNGKDMWLILVPGSSNIKPAAGTPYSKAGLVEEIQILPHIDMYTGEGEMLPGWLASQTDMLAQDWVAFG